MPRQKLRPVQKSAPGLDARGQHYHIFTSEGSVVSTFRQTLDPLVGQDALPRRVRETNNRFV